MGSPTVVLPPFVVALPRGRGAERANYDRARSWGLVTVFRASGIFSSIRELYAAPGMRPVQFADTGPAHYLSAIAIGGRKNDPDYKRDELVSLFGPDWLSRVKHRTIPIPEILRVGDVWPKREWSGADIWDHGHPSGHGGIKHHGGHRHEPLVSALLSPEVETTTSGGLHAS